MSAISDCTSIAERLPFNLGVAMQLIHSAGAGSQDPIADLRSAARCVQREIARMESAKAPAPASFTDVTRAMRALLDEAESRVVSPNSMRVEAS